MSATREGARGYGSLNEESNAMQVEILGPFRLELSAMQLIENGGWTAYAAVRNADDSETRERVSLLPYQRVVGDAVFASEAAALAAARRVAIALAAATEPQG
ncbi:hypothetical protein [Trinickia sp. Y13]|uniref:hypothetical protein n=1 Tax=Trinickia sp. Y13 TaxID=2917807 RepID=UPI002406D929|nr:hypothetical protein [Trinickia sp. Y13]MDG0024061.1 hypothetical protein [Trinickia sp. Y13]